MPQPGIRPRGSHAFRAQLRHQFFQWSIYVLSLSSPALAWEGYDWERNAFIGIEKGNLVRPGEVTEYFDCNEGSYYQGVVESLERYGHSVELEVYDFESGETRTFDMD